MRYRVYTQAKLSRVKPVNSGTWEWKVKQTQLWTSAAVLGWAEQQLQREGSGEGLNDVQRRQAGCLCRTVRHFVEWSGVGVEFDIDWNGDGDRQASEPKRVNGDDEIQRRDPRPGSL